MVSGRFSFFVNPLKCWKHILCLKNRFVHQSDNMCRESLETAFVLLDRRLRFSPLRLRVLCGSRPVPGFMIPRGHSWPRRPRRKVSVCAGWARRHGPKWRECFEGRSLLTKVGNVVNRSLYTTPKITGWHFDHPSCTTLWIKTKQALHWFTNIHGPGGGNLSNGKPDSGFSRYPPVIKHGNRKWTISRWFSHIKTSIHWIFQPAMFDETSQVLAGKNSEKSSLLSSEVHI